MIAGIHTVTKGKTGTFLAVGFGALMLGGCGGADGIAGKVISGGQEPIEISPETFAAPVSCPPMRLKTNTYLIRKFERGKEDEADALLYQATLKDWANTCSREGTGQRRIKLGFSGSVTPGPAWKGGEIVLPLRVEVLPVEDGEKPIVSELLQIPVSLGAGSPKEDWTLIENKYVIEQNQGASISFGFEEGRRR
ncbi:MAG: hypothetical protein ABJL55_14700 [Roseibium sp.]